MSRVLQEPKITEVDNGRQRHTHPAFGVIRLTNPHGGNEKLFGSDVPHSSRLSISICRAVLERDLSRDWIFGRDTICEFEMSHAQFAQFITGVGNGGGTPVTLHYASPVGAGLEAIPGIDAIETKHETFRREINESARSRLEAINQQIDQLRVLIESGKTPKGELVKIQKELERHASQLPGALSFVVKSAEEALENATTSAKIEVESFVAARAKELGIASLVQLAAPPVLPEAGEG